MLPVPGSKPKARHGALKRARQGAFLDLERAVFYLEGGTLPPDQSMRTAAFLVRSAASTLRRLLDRQHSSFT